MPILDYHSELVKGFLTSYKIDGRVERQRDSLGLLYLLPTARSGIVLPGLGVLDSVSWLSPRVPCMVLIAYALDVVLSSFGTALGQP